MSTDIELLIDLLHALEQYKGSSECIYKKLELFLRETDERIDVGIQRLLRDSVSPFTKMSSSLIESDYTSQQINRLHWIKSAVRNYQNERDELLKEFNRLTIDSPESVAYVTNVVMRLREYLEIDLSGGFLNNSILESTGPSEYTRKDSNGNDMNETPMKSRLKNLTNLERKRIHEMINRGLIHESDVRAFGKPAREQYCRIMHSIFLELDMIAKERLRHVTDYSSTEDEWSRNLLIKKIRDLRQQEETTRARIKPAETMKFILNQYRLIGPSAQDKGQKYEGTNYDSENPVIDALREVRRFLPADWINRSNETVIEPRLVERGYYFKRDDGVSVIALSPGRGILRCAFHEMGHHFEQLYPEIRKLEHEFYQRRTSGEELQWLGVGYSEQERARYDDFVNPYIGKDYGNTDKSSYELLSMGLEALYTASFSVMEDYEYQDFLFGILLLI